MRAKRRGTAGGVRDPHRGEAIQAGERALAYARAAATQAAEVLRIADAAFREGATTSIEVIDAQRRARDAETAAAVAEDTLR